MRIIQFTQPANRSLSPLFATGAASLAALENEMDRLLNSAFTGTPGLSLPEHTPVDLFEDKNNLYVRAEVPGVKREDIQVELVDGYLNLQATGRRRVGEQEESFTLKRSVSLSDEVLPDKVSASYENGVLTVTLPKREEAKPRRIAVNVN